MAAAASASGTPPEHQGEEHPILGPPLLLPTAELFVSSVLGDEREGSSDEEPSISFDDIVRIVGVQLDALVDRDGLQLIADSVNCKYRFGRLSPPSPLPLFPQGCDSPHACVGQLEFANVCVIGLRPRQRVDL